MFVIMVSLDVQGVDGLDIQGEGGVAGRQVEPCPGQPVRSKPAQVKY